MPEENEKMLTTEEILSELANDPSLNEKSSEDEVLTAEHRHSHGHHRHHSGHRHRHRKHRSSGSRKRSRQRKEKIRRFFRHYRKRLLMIAIVTVLSAALVATAAVIDSKTHWSGGGSSATSSSVAEGIRLITPSFDDEIVLVAPGVAEFTDPNNTLSTREIRNKYYENRLDFNKGLPVTLSYRAEGLPKGCVVSSAVFEIADNLGFEDARVFTRTSRQSSVDVYHLKTGTQYYYRITLTVSNGETVSTEGSFKTAGTPRVLTIDGAVNVRDFGGRTTLDGKTVRQGLLFRGSELDGAVEPTYKITDKGISDLLTVLGVRTDLDMRSPTDNVNGVDALGKNVDHIYFGASMYGDVFTEKGQKALRNIFAALSDKSNYPAYMHCTYGVDRTGTVCYLLGALLGMSEKDIVTDYSVSGLITEGFTLSNIEELKNGLNAYDGGTLQERTESFLLSAGVTEQEIQSIRSIFLTD